MWMVGYTLEVELAEGAVSYVCIRAPMMFHSSSRCASTARSYSFGSSSISSVVSFCGLMMMCRLWKSKGWSTTQFTRSFSAMLPRYSQLCFTDPSAESTTRMRPPFFLRKISLATSRAGLNPKSSPCRTSPLENFPLMVGSVQRKNTLKRTWNSPWTWSIRPMCWILKPTKTMGLKPMTAGRDLRFFVSSARSNRLSPPLVSCAPCSSAAKCTSSNTSSAPALKM
mmetsp:Transcript_11106/g.41482  ORF Transcript_11106/g.41482 Transcript_11106/m.41482 type:complete len:225 (-) Transcript_11106:198-872(-)